MKERPILFSTPMVRAIMEGRKTVTRRVVKDVVEKPDGKEQWGFSCFTPPGCISYRGVTKTETGKHYSESFYPLKYGDKGDRLWVRETFSLVTLKYGYDAKLAYYKADDTELPKECKWKPSIHMPKAAARIWLEITSVKVERLLSITNYEAVFEGIESWPDGNFKAYGKHPGKYAYARDSFFSLWESINGEGSTKSNPWVWVIEFKVLSTTGRP